MTAIKVSDALDRFSRYKQDLGGVSTDLFLDWCQAIANDVYRDLIKLDPNKFIGETTMSVTNGTQTLPTDYGNMQSLGTGFYQVANGVVTSTALPQTYVGSSLQGFYLTGDNQVVFTGFNGVTATYLFRYTKKLTQITSEDDYFTQDCTETGLSIIPYDYFNYLIKFLDTFYTDWDVDGGAEAQASQRYLATKQEFLDTYIPTPSVFPYEDSFAQNSFNGGYYNFYMQ